ncbi:hypothetical protein RSX24_028840 [Paenibacillus sp. ES5-4]
MEINIMAKAWNAAKRAQQRFGGSSRDYFALALREAWAETRRPKPAILRTLTGSRKHKTWVARITSVGGKYKYQREFIKDYRHLGNALEFRLIDGIYDVCDGGQRQYIQVISGEIAEIEESEIAVG